MTLVACNRYRIPDTDSLPQTDQNIVQQFKSQFYFQKTVSLSSTNHVLLVSDHQNKNYILKVSLDKNRLGNEASILKKLDGQHHVIKLLESYQCSVLRFGALLFDVYLTEIPMNSQRCETFAKQLLEV